ncbi:uncharacterized protein LOC129961619 [Argiope bruennichi]|uniref:Uncharacterized protein n=1 Tax=Argiope bruennichi TaxID=94029 RepID=A0A8T0FS20_ARGBR|nr:uncharacterized protein LOC129961619 [Argiope bruennichi]KAF8793947.1 hypothetical protein HNY73_001976 [Argiope bruennichi]
MWTLAVIIAFILTLVSPQWTIASPCSEQNMKDCELEAMYFLHSVNESENGYNIFCDNLKNSTRCPLDVDEHCKKQYPTASATYIKFFQEMVVWCNRSSPDRKAWFKVAFCARKHPREFNKCYKMKYKWLSNGTFDCKYWHFVSCWSHQVSLNCGEEAAELSKYIDDSIPDLFEESCKGCTGIISNYWILNLLAIFSLILRPKIEHLIIGNTGCLKT